MDHSVWFKNKKERTDRAISKLWWVTLVCFLFMMVELVGGIMSGSLAILTDAAH